MRWACGLLLVFSVVGRGSALAEAPPDADKLKAEVELLYREGKYVEALTGQRTLAERIKNAEIAQSGKPGAKTAAAFNAVAWYALFARSFREALAASERSEALAPERLLFKTNKVHALLLSDRVSEARTLYLRYKGEKLFPGTDRLWEDAITDDFISFQKAGLENRYFNEIVGALGVLHPELSAKILDGGQQVEDLYYARRYVEALPLAETVVVWTKERFGEARSEFAAALAWVGMIKAALGQNTEAEALYKRGLAIDEKALAPDDLSIAGLLNNLSVLYRVQGRYADAEPILKRSIDVYEKALGPDDLQVAISYYNLGQQYYSQGRYAEAEAPMRRGLDIRTKVLGPDHADVASSLSDLAVLYLAMGRFNDAEIPLKRCLDIREKVLPPDHPFIASSIGNLAKFYVDQGRYTAAEPLQRQALAIWEKGGDVSGLASAVNGLAATIINQGRYAEAEPLLKRAIATVEKAFSLNHPDLILPLDNLAQLYLQQGRYAEAETLLKRSLAIRDRSLGPNHPNVYAMDRLATLYDIQGRYSEAEPLFKRALAISEHNLGPAHPDVLQHINNLASMYHSQGRNLDAQSLLKRALSVWEKSIGPDHPAVATILNNLAEVYEALGHSDEAEPLLKRALAMAENTQGANGPDVSLELNNLAALYVKETRYRDAEPLLKRSLAIGEKVLGRDHLDVAKRLNNLAWLALNQGEWAHAADAWQRATDIIKRRAGRNVASESILTGKAKSEAERFDWYFKGLVTSTDRLVTEGRAERNALSAEMFEMAQWAQASEAAASLAQMAARGGADKPELGAIVRERQDLVGEWQFKDKALIAAKSLAPDKRNAAAEMALADRLAAIESRVGGIDTRLAKDFPEYAALASPKSISVAGVQLSLHDDEALVLFLDTDDRFKPLPEGAFIWVITKKDVRWVRSDIGTKAQQDRVAALRCGLDRDGNWVWAPDKQRWIARRAACEELRPEGLSDGDPLPFNPVIAHELYKELFGQVADLIEGKQLLIVPSGALTSLPFQVLVTKPPLPGQDYRSLAWLARGHALTVLPSAASLIALRRNAGRSAAPEPFIGFGNPVLNGHCGPVFIPKRCPDDDIKQAGAASPASRTARSLGEAPEYFRDGLADVAALRKACPLPDTAHELACVARSLGAPPSRLVLGKDMTEAAVKKMQLDRYRIIHFATHGLLAGEAERFAKARAEPALLFTPPDKATDEDDGLLSASEIARLKLDADWVIMSACNTAGGDKPGAEALSGLAKAFFYAGARALLVSHWPVDSYAATMLTSRTFAEMRRDTSIGRAEAFRRAMLALIDDSKQPRTAHPSVWAPFVVVGEGAASKM